MTFSQLTQKFELEGGKHRLLQMEGLRGIAILLVFVYHYYGLVWASYHGMRPVIDTLGVLGGSGVDLFFVLSGYLIYGAVNNPKFRFGTFLRRRVERIYPTFLVVLLYYVVMSLAFGGHSGSHQASWNRIPGSPGAATLYIVENLVFLPGVFPIRPIMNVAWSLSYEWFFYLLLPLAYWALRFRSTSARNRVLVVFGIAGAIVAAQLIVPTWFMNSNNLSRTSHIRSIMFLGGMIVYDLLHWKKAEEFHIERLSWLFAPLAAVIVLVLRWMPSPDHAAALIRRETTFSATLFVAYPLLVYIGIQGKTVLARALSLAPLRWLGNMSYSFYLFHGIALHGMGLMMARLQSDTHSLQLLVTESVILFPIALLLTTASCIPLFLLVERPASLCPRQRREGTPASIVNLILPRFRSKARPQDQVAG